MDEQDNSGGSSPYYMPTVVQPEKSSLYDKIRPEEPLTSLKYGLMGYEFDIDKKVYVKVSDNGINEKGASEIISLVRPLSTKNVTISKLKEANINGMIRTTCKVVKKKIIDNWLVWDIRTGSQASEILNLVFVYCKITLMQSENAGGRGLIMGTTNDTNINTSDNRSKGGFLGGIFRK